MNRARARAHCVPAIWTKQRFLYSPCSKSTCGLFFWPHGHLPLFLFQAKHRSKSGASVTFAGKARASVCPVLLRYYLAALDFECGWADML